MLLIQVWNEDPAGKKDFLGVVLLPLYSISAGYHSKQWYPLGKRSTRSHIRGDIEIEIACKSNPPLPPNSVDPQQIFQEVRQFPELRQPLSIQTLTKSQKLLSFENVDSFANTFTSNSFPFQLPPEETEKLEDIATRVGLLCTDSGSKRAILVSGMLLLTNYRLIFVPLVRFARTSCSCSENNHSDAALGTREIATETAIVVNIADIMHVVSDTEVDSNGVAGGEVGCVHETLRIKVIDGRRISFIFMEITTEGAGAAPPAISTASHRNSGVAGMVPYSDESVDASSSDTTTDDGVSMSPYASGKSSAASRSGKHVSTGSNGGISTMFRRVSNNSSTSSTVVRQRKASTDVRSVRVPLGDSSYLASDGAPTPALFELPYVDTTSYTYRFLTSQDAFIGCLLLDADDADEGSRCNRLFNRLFFRVRNF